MRLTPLSAIWLFDVTSSAMSVVTSCQSPQSLTSLEHQRKNQSSDQSISASKGTKMVSSFNNGKESSTNGSSHRKEHHKSGGSDTSDTLSTTSKLSKIGRRLRDSCRNLRGKASGCNSVSHNPEDYTSLQAPNESTRSKNFAPMDFSGQSGRIIDHRDMDMTPAEKLATKDSGAYFRRKIDTSKVEHLLTETQATIHLSQPWFHKGVGRLLAQKILALHNIDGLFLVRDSSVAGGYVISYFFSGRTYHTQVLPIVTPDDKVTYSLDNGRTRFFDLLQMVEFYQLNRCTLNHRLTHFVVAKTLFQTSTGSTNGRPESPTARSDSSSCQGTSDGSIDSHPSSKEVCYSAEDGNISPQQTPKMDSNHNSSIGSFDQDLASEASTMSDSKNSLDTVIKDQERPDDDQERDEQK